MIDCPQCGEETEELFEGYCIYCRDQNQLELDSHNAQYDYWQSLSNEQRAEQIRKASHD